MAKLQHPIQVALIGGAHGIKGALRVKTFTDYPLALAVYGPLYTNDGRILEIVEIRQGKNMVLVCFKDVNDRNAAEMLTNVALFVDRSALHDIIDDDEFYHNDLMELEVRDETDAKVGKVIAVHNFGGGDILDIQYRGRKGVLIPFTEAAVKTVDIKAGYVGIDTAAAGLVEGNDDEFGSPLRASKFDTRKRPRGPKSTGGYR